MLNKKVMKLLALALVFLLILTSCSSDGPAQETVPSETETTETLTHEEIVEKAKAEGKLVVYSNTSRISQAAEKFTEKYGIEVEASNLKDGELIEKVSREVSGNIQGADMVLVQDGGRVFGQLINPGYLVNYVPENYKDIIPEQYQEPLAFQFVNKVFIFNNELTNEDIITNVWELTEEKWHGKIQFKDPNQEGVNSNFLTMITNEEWSNKLAESYKEYFGKDIELTTENAGYEWMKMFFNNGVVLGNSDTTISENVGIKGQTETRLGLFVYSKTRYDETKNLTLRALTEVAPFSGFYYPIYVQSTSNAANPYAAKLMTEFLLTEEGFEPWGKDVGAYSSNPQIPVNEDDEPLAFWEERLIVEDPVYLYENRTKVEEFYTKILAE